MLEWGYSDPGICKSYGTPTLAKIVSISDMGQDV